MDYSIKRVVVIGSGTMGGGIAAHVANAGIPVYLLDVAPTELTSDEESQGLTLGHPRVRNRIVNSSFDRLKKAKPPAFFSSQTSELVTVGNLSDNFDWVGEGDWIVEAIVENVDAKRELVARIEQVRKDRSIVSSNTSGLPISAIAAQASNEFKRHFLGTHFFNPPRYMKLLEVIPTSDTDPEITSFMKTFAENRLGKGVVICNDTPNFIANRLGSISGATALNFILEQGYTVEEADAILGPLIGRPRTALFRLQDLVGLDVSASVGENLYLSIEHDESRDVLRNPALRTLRATQLERGRLGDKTGQGFYRKPPKGQKGEVLSLDLETFEYRSRIEPDFPSIATAMKTESLPQRIKFVLEQSDKVGALARHVVYNTLAYASRRIPEITSDIINVDRAVRWGFSHELGPFEIWDCLGVRKTVAAMNDQNIQVGSWVNEMLAAGHESFYQSEGGRSSYYDPASKSYKFEPIDDQKIALNVLKSAGRVVRENAGASLIDTGDGVLCLEFHSKTNTFDSDIQSLLVESIEIVESGSFAGLVIGSTGSDFCVGATLSGLSATTIQETLNKIRFCSKPVVTAPFGKTLGIGAVLAMSGSAVVATGETYFGLVEPSIGLPSTGACKELVRRLVSKAIQSGVNDPLPLLQQSLQAIGSAKVSTSAVEAKSMGILSDADRIVMNRDHQVSQARQLVLQLAAAGYSAAVKSKCCYAAGRDALAALRVGLHAMREGEFVSKADFERLKKIAFVLCGGDISAPQWVDEKYFLDLERDTFSQEALAQSV